MPLDLALAWNPELRCADLVWTGAGLALDATPASALLVSALAHRRAQDDDALPGEALGMDPGAPPTLALRGGSAIDALDQRGELCGSRLWLLDRAPDTQRAGANAGDETRLRAERYAAEAVAWFARRGYAPQVVATWLARGKLRVQFVVGSVSLAVAKAPG